MKIWIVDLESVSTRYTCEWKNHIPSLITEFLKNSGEYNSTVEIIDGPSDIPKSTTPGAFLNFGGTNIYKSAQMEKLSRVFTLGEIKNGDHILFTDAWHPGVIQVKYMSELLNIRIKLHGIWHAGSYDPQDFLGRLIGDKPWVRHAEKSFYECYDHNYYATYFHKKLFAETLLDFTPSKQTFDLKMIQTGLPFEYLKPLLSPLGESTKKKNLVLFPHRIAPEKQIDIFNDLSKEIPELEWVVCQSNALSKNEYHQMLSEAKIIFSANLQETLGISMMEGMLVGAHPMVPDRLSYHEMYPDTYKYPSIWTENFELYQKHKIKLITHIRNVIHHYKFDTIIDDSSAIFSKYFTSNNLLFNLKKQVIHIETNKEINE